MVILEFERFCENFKNGSIDFSKTKKAYDGESKSNSAGKHKTTVQKGHLVYFSMHSPLQHCHGSVSQSLTETQSESYSQALMKDSDTRTTNTLKSSIFPCAQTHPCLVCKQRRMHNAPIEVWYLLDIRMHNPEFQYSILDLRHSEFRNRFNDKRTVDQ